MMLFWLFSLVAFAIPFFVYWIFRVKAREFAEEHSITEAEFAPYLKKIDVPMENVTRYAWISLLVIAVIWGLAICWITDCYEMSNEMDPSAKAMTYVIAAIINVVSSLIFFYFAIVRRGVGYLLYVLIMSPIVSIFTFMAPPMVYMSKSIFLITVLLSAAYWVCSLFLVKFNDSRKFQMALALKDKYHIDRTSFWKRIWLTPDIVT